MKKIKEIILNDNYTNLDKIILIYKEVDKTAEGLAELAAALNMDKFLLEDYEPAEAPVVDMKVEPVSSVPEYIKSFYDAYLELYNVKFKFTKKEIGCINKIKATVDLGTWNKIIKLVFYNCKQGGDGKELTYTWKFITEDVRPSVILLKLNFVLKEVNSIQAAKNKKWAGYRND